MIKSINLILVATTVTEALMCAFAQLYILSVSETIIIVTRPAKINHLAPLFF